MAINAERQLWQTVLNQALMDALRPISKKFTLVEKQEAIEWINMFNPDFIEVCQNADMNPLSVYEKFNSGEITFEQLEKTKKEKD